MTNSDNVSYIVDSYVEQTTTMKVFLYHILDVSYYLLTAPTLDCVYFMCYHKAIIGLTSVRFLSRLSWGVIHTTSSGSVHNFAV